MPFKYRRVDRDAEKWYAQSIDSAVRLDDVTAFHDVSLSPRNERVEACRTFLESIIYSRFIWIFHLFFFGLSTMLFAYSMLCRPSTVEHVQKFSAWSPAHDIVEYSETIYNITTQKNEFVGFGPTVDQAWSGISHDMGHQWLSEEDFERLEMPLESSAKLFHPETGEKGYQVGMEVFHQLSCLDLLRKASYHDYYAHHDTQFAPSHKKVLQMRTDHCIEMLRQNIQCNGDVGLFAYTKTKTVAIPNLNSKHMCRNFEKIRDWAKENSVAKQELV